MSAETGHRNPTTDLNALSAELSAMTPDARKRAMTMKLRPTSRGFLIYEWRDFYGQHCSLQESSLVEPLCVWLGVGSDRMHLTQDQCRDLAKALRWFARAGSLLNP